MFNLFPFTSNGNRRNEMSIFDSLFNDDLISSFIAQIISSDLMKDLTNELYDQRTYNIELKDYEDYYLIKGYLPDLNPKDISIDFEKNKVILTIKNKKVYSSNNNSIVTVVQTGGNIIKTFYIDEVNVSKIKASFDDGLLLITLPKLRKDINDSNTTIIDVDNYKIE